MRDTMEYQHQKPHAELLNDTVFNKNGSNNDSHQVALNEAGLGIKQISDFNEHYTKALGAVELQNHDFHLTILMYSMALASLIAMAMVGVTTGVMSFVPTEWKFGWKALIALGVFFTGCRWPGAFFMGLFYKHYLHKGLRHAKDNLAIFDNQARVMDNTVLQQELAEFFQHNQPALFDNNSSAYTTACQEFKEHLEKKEFGLALCNVHQIFQLIPHLDNERYRQLVENYPALKLAMLNQELKQHL
jgi:hypothetical protein